MIWTLIFRQLFGVKSSCCAISLEDCPDFSFVSSLQFLSCSSRIPLLSFAFPFLVGQWRPESHFLCVFFFKKKKTQALGKKKKTLEREKHQLCAKKKIPYKKNTSTTKLLDKNNVAILAQGYGSRACEPLICMFAWVLSVVEQNERHNRSNDCCWQQQQRLQGWNCWIRNLFATDWMTRRMRRIWLCALPLSRYLRRSGLWRTVHCKMWLHSGSAWTSAGDLERKATSTSKRLE